MRKIKFTKMSGTGNDFVMIDNRKKVVPRSLRRFARALCFRQRGIGADGVILLEGSRRYDFRMRIFNADGSEAEMCGNGARCVAQFARDCGMIGKETCVFDTLAGPIEACFTRRGVRISLGPPQDYRSKYKLTGIKGDYYFVNTGVPHVVRYDRNVTDTKVVDQGRVIRRHRHYAPAGTNVNFVQQLGDKEIYVRTYERGVEDETLACGTGSAACVVVGIVRGFLASPVKVRTSGGDILYVHYKHTAGFNEPVYLEGKVVTTFHGEVNNVNDV